MDVVPQSVLTPESVSVSVDSDASDATDSLLGALMSKYGLAELESILVQDPWFMDYVANAKPDMTSRDKIVKTFSSLCSTEPTIDCNHYTEFVLAPTLPSGAQLSRCLPVGVTAAGMMVVMSTDKDNHPHTILYCMASGVPISRSWVKMTARELPQLKTTAALGVYGTIISGVDTLSQIVWWLDILHPSAGRTQALPDVLPPGTGIAKVLATSTHVAILTNQNTVVLMEIAGSCRYTVISVLQEKLYDPGTASDADRPLRDHHPTCIAFDELSPQVFLIGTDHGYAYVYELQLEGANNSMALATHILPATTEPEYDTRIYKYPSREPLLSLSARQVLKNGVLLSTTAHSMTCVLYDMLTVAHTGGIMLRHPISTDRDLGSAYVSAAFCGTSILVHSTANNTIEIKSVSNTGERPSELHKVAVHINDSGRSVTGVYTFPPAMYSYPSTFISLGMAVVMMPDGHCVFIAPKGGLVERSLANATK